MDNGLHLIDLIDDLLGEVSEVFGLTGESVWRLGSAEDNGFALMRNRQGAVASLHASWTEWTGYRFFIEAYGDRGMVRASYAPMFSKEWLRSWNSRNSAFPMVKFPFCKVGNSVAIRTRSPGSA